MKEVKLNKNELLKIVRENREKHITEFDEAVKDYKILVLKISTDNLKFAKTGELEKFKKIKALPAAPVSYQNSYDRAIRMLELSIDDEIVLDDTIFNQLVLDDWAWKQSFTASSMLYKNSV